ncbi:MAG: TetR/AcrR family transcriptional regulator [bacterium]|nr:TetR/AcrR family transcriptional regulator [bacterium]
MQQNQARRESKPQRRTQAERREDAQRRLCEAAIASLAERGYAGASTTEIAKRAGLSQGGLFGHYASKAELFAAAATAVYADMRDDYRRALRAAGQGDENTAASIRILWDLYQRPEMKASLELAMAARTDSRLRDALEPVFHRATEENQALAAELSPRSCLSRPSVLATVIWAIQGATMDALVTPDVEATDEFLSTLTAFAQPSGT